MNILFNQVLENNTRRRDILKYGTLAGISTLIGLNILNKNTIMFPKSISTIKNLSENITLDYSTKSYNVFLINKNNEYINSLLSNHRIEHIYSYNSILDRELSNKVTVSNNLSSLLLSLGSIIPFDYDISSLDVRSWKVRAAFLYISKVYADIQNSNQSSLNEEKLLSSIKILGKYNKNIYLVNNKSLLISKKAQMNNDTVNPIGNIVVL